MDPSPPSTNDARSAGEATPGEASGPHPPPQNPDGAGMPPSGETNKDNEAPRPVSAPQHPGYNTAGSPPRAPAQNTLAMGITGTPASPFRQRSQTLQEEVGSTSESINGYDDFAAHFTRAGGPSPLRPTNQEAPRHHHQEDPAPHRPAADHLTAPANLPVGSSVVSRAAEDLVSDSSVVEGGQSDPDDDSWEPLFRPPTPHNRPSRVDVPVSLDKDIQWAFELERDVIVGRYNSGWMGAVEFAERIRRLHREYDEDEEAHGVVGEKMDAEEQQEEDDEDEEMEETVVTVYEEQSDSDFPADPAASEAAPTTPASPPTNKTPVVEQPTEVIHEGSNANGSTEESAEWTTADIHRHMDAMQALFAEYPNETVGPVSPQRQNLRPMEVANVSSGSSSNNTSDDQTIYNLQLLDRQASGSQKPYHRRRSPVQPPCGVPTPSDAFFQLPESVISSPGEPTSYDVERSAQLDSILTTPRKMKAIPLRLFPKPMEEVAEVTEPINPTPEWSLESESLAVEDTQEEVSESIEITASSDKQTEQEPEKAKSPEKTKKDSKESDKSDDANEQSTSASIDNTAEAAFGRGDEGSEAAEKLKNGENAVPEKADSTKQSDEEQGQAENSEASTQSDVSNQSSASIEDITESSFGRVEQESEAKLSCKEVPEVVDKVSSEEDVTKKSESGKETDKEQGQTEKNGDAGGKNSDIVEVGQSTPKQLQSPSEQQYQPAPTTTTSTASQNAETAHEVVPEPTESSASSNDKYEKKEKEKSKSPEKKHEKEDSARTSNESDDASKQSTSASIDNNAEAAFGHRDEGSEAVEQEKNGEYEVPEKAESGKETDDQRDHVEKCEDTGSKTTDCVQDAQATPSQVESRSEQQDQPAQTTTTPTVSQDAKVAHEVVPESTESSTSSDKHKNEEKEKSKSPEKKEEKEDSADTTSSESKDASKEPTASIDNNAEAAFGHREERSEAMEQSKNDEDVPEKAESDTQKEGQSSPSQFQSRSEQQDQPIQTNASSITAGNEEVQAPSNEDNIQSNEQTPAESVKIQMPSRLTQLWHAQQDKLNEQQKHTGDTNAENEVVERPSPVLTSSSSQITTQVEPRAASPTATVQEEPIVSDVSNNETIDVEMEEVAVPSNASVIEAANLDGIEVDTNASPVQPTNAIPTSEPPSQQARDVTAGIRKRVLEQFAHAEELKKAKKIEQPSATAVPSTVPTSVAPPPAPAPPMQLRTAARLAELLARSTPEQQTVPQKRDMRSEKKDTEGDTDVNVVEDAGQVHPTTGRPRPPVPTAPTTAPTIQTEPIRHEVVDRTASPDIPNTGGVVGYGSNRSENASASSVSQVNDEPQPSQSPAPQPSTSPSLAATIESIKKLILQSLEQPAGNEAATNRALNADIETELQKYMKSVPHKCSTCGQNCNGCPIEPANGASKTDDEHQASADSNTNDPSQPPESLETPAEDVAEIRDGPEDSAADGNEEPMDAEDNETVDNELPQSPISTPASPKSTSAPVDDSMNIRELSEVSFMETEDGIEPENGINGSLDGSNSIVPMNDSDFEAIQLSDYEEDMVIDEPELTPVSTPERPPTPRPPTPLSRTPSPVRQPTSLSRTPSPGGHLCGRHCRCPRMYGPPKNRRPARPAPYRRANPRQDRHPLPPRDHAPRRRQTDPEFGRLDHIRTLAGANLPDAPPVVDAEQTAVIDGIHLDVTNQVSLVRGEHFEAALYRSGVVVARGYFEGGSTAAMSIRHARNQPITLFNQPDDPATSIVAGPNHLVILTRSGHIYTIGRALEGQLGVVAYNLERYRQSSISPAAMLRRVFDDGREVLFTEVRTDGNVTIAIDRRDAIEWNCGEGIGPHFTKMP